MALHVTLPYLYHGMILHLPLVHQGKYCCVHQVPAFAAPGLPLSTSRITKVLPMDSTPQVHASFKDMLAFLSDQRQFAPAAYDHRYIAPFFVKDVEESSVAGLQPALALVRPWYHEDILQYGNSNPGVSKIRLLIQAAQAVEHLHRYDIVHGHIHPGNIFITDQGCATVADASVYTLACRFILHPLGRIPLQSSSIYQAPEYLYPGTEAFIQPAKPSDVYALASVILAVFTGYPPFYESLVRTTERAVAKIILNGHLDIPKPDGIGNTLWALLQQCWQRDPTARPGIGELVTSLEDIDIYQYD